MNPAAPHHPRHLPEPAEPPAAPDAHGAPDAVDDPAAARPCAPLTRPAASAASADALLLASAGGCRASFEALYRLTSGRIYAILLRMTPDPAAAADQLQAVYLQAWRDCRRPDRSSSSACAWLAAMARRQAMVGRLHHPAAPQASAHNGRPDTTSRRSPNATPHASPDRSRGGSAAASRQAPSQPEPEPALLDSPTELQRAGALQRGLASLPLAQRHSLDLAYCSGLSFHELARQMDQPAATVRGWVRGALVQLRSVLPDAR